MGDVEPEMPFAVRFAQAARLRGDVVAAITNALRAPTERVMVMCASPERAQAFVRAANEVLQRMGRSAPPNLQVGYDAKPQVRGLSFQSIVTDTLDDLDRPIDFLPFGAGLRSRWRESFVPARSYAR